MVTVTAPSKVSKPANSVIKITKHQRTTRKVLNVVLRSQNSQRCVIETITTPTLRADVPGWLMGVEKRSKFIGRLVGHGGEKKAAWGESVPGTALVQHKGKVYVQVAVEQTIRYAYFVGGREVSKEVVNPWIRSNGGKREVGESVVRTYSVESVVGISADGVYLKMEG